MQIGSSKNSRYYMPYQNNKSVKCCAGLTKDEEGKAIPNETSENPDFAEFVDYQEVYRAWMSQNGGNKVDYHFGISYRVSETDDDTKMSRDMAATGNSISGAVTIAESEDEGEFLGLTMVPEEGQSVTYGMRAMLSDKSTSDNPIVQVVSNLGGKKVIYNVEINKVNPNNATQLEMFALLSYTDKMGITDGGTFGSHQQLEVYGGNASNIGYCGSLSGADVFLNEKFDWASIMEKMVQVYKDAGIENQAEDCKALFDFFGTYTEQEKEFYRALIAKLESLSNTGSVLGTQEPSENATIEKSISARYTTTSTKENPIVEVSLQMGEETITQEINIKEVNPRKATEIEMYAFFYHQDMVSERGNENTWQKFSEYVENAVQNGHFEGNQSYEEFTEKEHDWQKVIISMWDDYSNAGIYSQMQECIRLNEAMEKASIQFVDFDKITFVNKSSEVFFTYSGINVPAQFQTAWMEVAGTMEDLERYGHFTQVLFRRIEKELEDKAVQDGAGAIEAAIEAVKKALQDLEDTPTDVIANHPDTKKEIQELKSYYEAFMQKLEALKENSAESAEATAEDTTEDITVMYQKFLAMYMEQIFIKIQNGDTEPTYQIGAQSFTEKEWEEFLEKFDSIEEAIQKLMKEEQERKEAEEAKKENELAGTVSAGNGLPQNYGLETWYQGEKVEWSVKKENAPAIDDGALLTAETTSCKYETADPDDEDILYVTFYTEDGIRCKKLGEEDFEWSITFEDKEQYNKVMEFLGNFPSDWNIRFAAHENFWNDFLNDEIDMEGFMEFINGTNKGVPDFSITVGDSMYIDKDKMQWAKYTNPLESRFYTSEEMHRMQMEIIAANQAKLKKLTDSYGEVYKQNHPDYNGERIFCEYPGGPLYTADEIGRLKWEQFLADMDMTEEEMQQKREEWRAKVGYPEY